MILILLIPLSMIRDVIADRGAVRYEATQEIMRIWGAEQLVAGPILVVAYEETQPTHGGRTTVSRNKAFVLPQDLDISAVVEPEIRYRGLHKVPVYSATITISGTLPSVVLDDLGVPSEAILWSAAYVAVSVSDARAIAATPTLTIDGKTSRFRPGGDTVGQLNLSIAAPLDVVLDARQRSAPVPFSLTLKLNGTRALRFIPLGDTTTASVESSWPSPSFIGGYLPESREIGDDGFSARWQLASIGRELPSRWIHGRIADTLVFESAFGFELYIPVSLYRLTLRATKYGILFIGLTFVAYFMFEVIVGLRLHPLQYLLVGLANTMFYLLLISLAEHTGFGWAYLLSVAASSGLIVGYSHSILASRLRAVIVALILLLLYALLYMTLKAESFALLAGSIGLWIGLALIMYLTRRIDWYAGGREAEETGGVSETP
jgi:inner membrane protein